MNTPLFKVDHEEHNLESVVTQELENIYNSISVMDKLNNNDYIISQLITEYKKYTEYERVEKALSYSIINFISSHHLYHYASPSLLERLLQDYYYLTNPEFYIHCIHTITQISDPLMTGLLCDHCTTFYNHPIKTDIHKLQTILTYLPIECIYHILFESVGRKSDKIIFFILHYLGEKRYTEDILRVYLHSSIFKHRYKHINEQLSVYIENYRITQRILNECMYKDEVSVVNLFLYGKRS